MVKMYTLKWAMHKYKDNYNCRDSPQGVRSSSPILGFPAMESCAEEMKT